jgi:hypothetical protein
LRVVHAKSVIERIYEEVERAKALTNKLPTEILLSPEETLELKKTIWPMLPRKYRIEAGLPPGLKLWGTPVRLDEAVIG